MDMKRLCLACSFFYGGKMVFCMYNGCWYWEKKLSVDNEEETKLKNMTSASCELSHVCGVAAIVLHTPWMCGSGKIWGDKEFFVS